MDNDEYIRREGEHDEEKRRKFLEQQKAEKEGSSVIKRKLGAVKSKLESDYAPYKRAGQKIKQPFSEAKEYVETRRAERDIKAFKKHEDREAHNFSIQEAAEIRVYGRTLTPDERAKISEHREQVISERKAKWEARKEKVRQFNENLQQLNEGSGKFEGITTGLNWEVGSGGVDSMFGGAGNNVNTDKWFVTKQAPMDSLLVKPKPVERRKVSNVDNSILNDGLPDISNMFVGSLTSNSKKKQGQHKGFQKGLYDDLLTKPKGKSKGWL